MKLKVHLAQYNTSTADVNQAEDGVIGISTFDGKGNFKRSVSAMYDGMLYQRSFAPRAARGCPWSAQARLLELIGRSRIPRGPCKRRRKGRALESKNRFRLSTFAPARRRRDVRIEASWSMFGPNRWLVERSSTGK